MTSRVIRWAECRVMPWANGGGETVEIAISPTGATFADFDWRLSSALVASPGPFSRLDGVDRTLTVTSDGVLALTIDGRGARLDRTSEPLRFSGGADVTSEIPDGPVRDFNVMTRRGRAQHSVGSLHLAAAYDVPPAPGLLALFVAAGSVETEGSCRERLEAGDTLLVPLADAALRLTPAGDAHVVLVRVGETAVDPRRHGVESASV